jgi:crotonobetainyl-CoA:carnitine CoA-transferase CaiB-like acyl-CoA transferase
VTGQAAQPMPVRLSAWAIYDVFDTRVPGEQVFVGVVSDGQWRAFCAAFGLTALGDDPALARNNQRVEARDVILPQIRVLFAVMTRAALVAKLESVGLPFAPIARPDELFDDRHLVESGGLLPVTIPGGAETRLPGLPLEFDGKRLPLRHDIPLAGANEKDILEELGWPAA